MTTNEMVFGPDEVDELPDPSHVTAPLQRNDFGPESWEDVDEQHIDFLYCLLEERPPEACISHKSMPTREQHAAFVRSKPYKEWCVIKAGKHLVGSVYITKNNEIGIAVDRRYARHGFASTAVFLMYINHKKSPVYANIAPGNYASKALFHRMGFRPLQEVWVKTEKAQGYE